MAAQGFQPQQKKGFTLLEELPYEAMFRRASSTWKDEYQNQGLLALNVAENNLPTPKHIRNSLTQVSDLGLLGYTDVTAEIGEAVSHWQNIQFGADVSAEECVYVPRLIQAVAIIAREIIPAGSTVIEFAPAYGPIDEAIIDAGHKITHLPLEMTSGRAKINFSLLEETIRQQNPQMMLMCSPHNPTGRVWHFEELKIIAELCAKHNVLLLSDEVHADLAWGATHIPMTEVVRSIKHQPLLVSGLSPAKGFNLAGLEAAALVIPNRELRNTVQSALVAYGHRNIAALTRVGLLAAWGRESSNLSRAWLTELHQYIAKQHEKFRHYADAAGARTATAEATFLGWAKDITGNLRRQLDREGIIFSPGSNYAVDDTWIRVVLTTPSISSTSAATTPFVCVR